MAREDDAKGGCGLSETGLFAVSGRIHIIPYPEPIAISFLIHRFP